ncbi:glycosyltransferase [Tundrisphaera sp. TA3]|uniref:glycosyltransferase n=1 Tax=Tundrisphaera sp. TA3 TaxID=3435775 RepID=UPI003EBC1B7D
MPDVIIQRCVFPAERRLRPLYYRMDRPQEGRSIDPAPPDRRSIWIGRGAKLITDTYFNSVFESYWRRHTRVEKLRLRLELSGRGTVLLLRRSLAAGLEVLDEVDFDFDADGSELALDVPVPHLHHRESGALHFDIIARSPSVRLARAEWVARDVEPDPINLVAGYCTFNRERFLLDNVRSLLADPDVAGRLGRIVVVDQGTSKIKDHPGFAFLEAAAGDKLHLIEQENFGGAGGFTRSILEARAMPGATHMLLMDDDAITEPESVFRVAAFQALAREPMGVGGQMLDMLRPMEIYESGAFIDPATLGVKTPVHRLRAESSDSLAPFLEVEHVHYNAWWFFAFPLDLVDRIGLPLPVFIRGDDAEYGYRMHRAGIPTVTVPGMGIWHEPFYLKRGGWQAYYDLRNMLVLTSIHFPMDRRHVLKVFLKRFLTQLLSHNYFEAALLVEAAVDFCAGPEILDAAPGAVHRKLLALKRELAMGSVCRSRCLPLATPADPPASRAQIRKRLALCFWRQLTRPSPPPDAQPDHAIPDEYARWWHIGMADVVAAEDWHAEEHRIYRRSRETFRSLLMRGAKAGLMLRRDHGRVVARWREAFARLTGGAFWDRYLGIGPGEARPGRDEDRARDAA